MIDGFPGLYIDNILQKIRSMVELMGTTHILIHNNSETVERNRLQLLQTVLLPYLPTVSDALKDESKV